MECINQKAPCNRGKKFITECHPLKNLKFNSWKEAVEKYFDLIDNDSVIDGRVRLLHYLKISNLIPENFVISRDYNNKTPYNEYFTFFKQEEKEKELRIYEKIYSQHLPL